MIKKFYCYNKAGIFLTYFFVLAALSGILWSLSPGIAGATNTVGEKTNSLTITVNDNGTVTTAATLSIGDLQSMNQVRYTYSSVDNGTEVLFYATEGVLLTDILAGANIDLNNISKFTFTATDSYSRTLAMEYLLDTPRYYYPEMANNLSTQNAVLVQPILALKSMEFDDKYQLDFNLIDDYYSARLFFGQTEQDLVCNKNYVKWTNHIEVFTKPASAQPPALSADMVNNSAGQPVTLTFLDDPAWRAVISDVTVDGSSVSGKYTVGAGTITIDGSVFGSEKDYAVVIKAEGYLDAAVTQHKGLWPEIFTVDGAAVTMSSFTAAELRAMPVTTVQFGAETCTGVAIKDLLAALNITEGSWQAQINVTDAATFHIDPVSVAELLNPANKYLLTYDIDGQPITVGPGNETTLRVYWGIGIVYKNVTGITISAMPAGDSVTLELSKYAAQPGDNVTASGTAGADTWVSIKVVDSDQNIIVFDAVKSKAQGSYSCTFKLPDSAAGTLTVVAGYGGNVANKTITVSTMPAEDTEAPGWIAGSLTASGISQSGLTLSWSGASDNVGVTGYNVYQGATRLNAGPVAGNSYNVTSLSPNTEYTFTVQAADAAGNESTGGPSVTVTTTSSVVSVTLELSKYAAQPGDSVTASGTADADTWVSIKVLDSAQSIIFFDAVKSDAQGSYSCSFKLPDNAAGALTVVAGYGSNVANKAINVSTLPAVDTAAPAWSAGSLTAAGVSQSGLTLSWSGASDNVGVTGYNIYQGTTLLNASPVSGDSYNVTGLSAGTEYTFTVQALDAAGNESIGGPSVTVTTKSPGAGGGGGGASSAPPAVTSTTGEASVSPEAGGKISLGEDVLVDIPAGALKGTTEVDVTIQEVSGPITAPADFKLLGVVYEFKVGGDTGYSFNKPVTLTFTFDPASLPAGETPTIYYYDETAAKWVDIGGTISGSTITVQVDHFTKFAVMAGGKDEQPQVLKDITGHWANISINELVSLGAIAGYPDGSFRPDSNITRAEFAVVLAKAFKLEPQNGKVFADTAGHWARDYIAAAAASGIVSGYDDNAFGPDDPITREQMAVMIVKAAGLSPVEEETIFADSSRIADWARRAVATASRNGIISGYPDNTMRPLGNATRAEAVTVIAEALGLTK
jgi:chitodextrinase